MVKITFDIPADKKDRIIDGYCGHYGYQETVTDEEGKEIPNPQTKTQFVKKRMIQSLKDPVITYENKQVREAQTADIKTEVDNIDIT